MKKLPTATWLFVTGVEGNKGFSRRAEVHCNDSEYQRILIAKKEARQLGLNLHGILDYSSIATSEERKVCHSSHIP